MKVGEPHDTGQKARLRKFENRAVSNLRFSSSRLSLGSSNESFLILHPSIRPFICIVLTASPLERPTNLSLYPRLPDVLLLVSNYLAKAEPSENRNRITPPVAPLRGFTNTTTLIPTFGLACIRTSNLHPELQSEALTHPVKTTVLAARLPDSNGGLSKRLDRKHDRSSSTIRYRR